MTAPAFIGLAIALISLAIFGAERSMAADNEHGAQLAAMCASCHRLDGRDKGIPSIVGMDRKTLANALAAFKSGARSSLIMHAVALSLTDAEIATLAEYLAVRPKGNRQQ